MKRTKLDLYVSNRIVYSIRKMSTVLLELFKISFLWARLARETLKFLLQISIIVSPSLSSVFSSIIDSFLVVD